MKKLSMKIWKKLSLLDKKDILLVIQTLVTTEGMFLLSTYGGLTLEVKRVPELFPAWIVLNVCTSVYVLGSNLRWAIKRKEALLEK